MFVGVVGASERDLTVGGTIERSFDGQKDQRTKFWWSEGPQNNVLVVGGTIFVFRRSWRAPEASSEVVEEFVRRFDDREGQGRTFERSEPRSDGRGGHRR